MIEEDETALEEEYAKFNDYDDKVTTFSIRLQDLELSMETPSAPAENLSLGLTKRLRYIETELRTLDESVLSKWRTPTRNLKVGDVVCVRDEPMAPTKWPLARITKVHPGQDGKVRVVTIKTAKGTYTRPSIKLVPLVCEE